MANLVVHFEIHASKRVRALLTGHVRRHAGDGRLSSKRDWRRHVRLKMTRPLGMVFISYFGEWA